MICGAKYTVCLPSRVTFWLDWEVGTGQVRVETRKEEAMTSPAILTSGTFFKVRALRAPSI